MGTRNLTKVINEQGEVVVAQYGQWDGYPSGQGVNALNAIFYYLDEIKQGIKRVYWISQDELDEIYASLPELNYLGTEDSNNFGMLYPNLTRDTCAKILNVIAFSVGKVGLVDNSDFEQDTGFCEGVYTLDLQQNKFISVYHGVKWEYNLDKLPTPQQYLDGFDEAAEKWVKAREYDAELGNEEVSL